jgi:hypothetical protein
MKNLTLILFFFVFLTTNAQSIDTSSHFSAGIRLKKYVGFYWVNGLSGEWHSPKLLNNKLHLGINIATSKLGSALYSNALTTWETELSLLYYFRKAKPLHPIARINIGLASAQLGSSFSTLSSRTMLLSLETGCHYTHKKYSYRLYGGYNLLTGNGISGLGTIYPIYAGVGIMYSLD